jgi:hypothetical protein
VTPHRLRLLSFVCRYDVKYGSAGLLTLGWRAGCAFALNDFDNLDIAASQYTCPQADALEVQCTSDSRSEARCQTADRWDGFYRPSVVRAVFSVSSNNAFLPPPGCTKPHSYCGGLRKASLLSMQSLQPMQNDGLLIDLQHGQQRLRSGETITAMLLTARVFNVQPFAQKPDAHACVGALMTSATALQSVLNLCADDTPGTRCLASNPNSNTSSMAGPECRTLACSDANQTLVDGEICDGSCQPSLALKVFWLVSVVQGVDMCLLSS